MELGFQLNKQKKKKKKCRNPAITITGLDFADEVALLRRETAGT